MLLFKPYQTSIPGVTGLMFYCPGCETRHAINIGDFGRRGWTLEGPDDTPTVHPSILTTGGARDERCHLFIRAGQIQYLDDCTHHLAGKTVPMVDLNEPDQDDDV